MPRSLTIPSLASFTATLALAGAIALAPAVAPADVSFKGKRINVIIGSNPGGGTDGTTRLVGRYLEKYLPGKPRMIYRNMPAGHGIMANNYFFHEAKRNGTFWFGGSSSYVDPNNLRRTVVKYDPTKYRYIGGIDRGGSIVITRKSNLANLTDKSKPPVVMGVIDGSRTWAQMLVWGSEYLGWNIKYVVGYPGSGALILAARKGEIDGFGTSNLSMQQTMEKTGQFTGLAQIGQFVRGKYQPRSSFKDVPVIADMMAGKTHGLADRAFDFWTKANQIDKFYALPPKTPDDVVKAYRAAWDKATGDPGFIKYGKLQFSEDFTPQTGEDIGHAIRVTAYPADDILNYMRSIRVKHGLPAERLTDDQVKKLAKKLGVSGLTVKAKLDAVKRGGRWLHFKKDGKAQKVKVSSSRTKVKIDGKKAKRKALKAGMTCEIGYATNGGEASSVACTNQAS